MGTSIYDTELALRWHRYLPPARPSAGDLALFERFMGAPKDTLILGSTPDLRALAGRCGHRLKVVEAEPQVFEILKAIMPNEADEACIASNWLDLDVPDRFDLAIADGSINMLPPDHHQRFIEKVGTHVRPGGLFLCHVHLVTESLFSTEAQIMEWARDQHEHIYTASRQHLAMLWMNRENGEIDNLDCWNRFRQLHADGVITLEEYAIFQRLFEFDTISVFWLWRDRFQQLVDPWFTIEDELLAGDYVSHEAKPIFCLRRRS